MSKQSLSTQIKIKHLLLYSLSPMKSKGREQNEKVWKVLCKIMIFLFLVWSKVAMKWFIPWSAYYFPPRLSALISLSYFTDYIHKRGSSTAVFNQCWNSLSTIQYRRQLNVPKKAAQSWWSRWMNSWGKKNWKQRGCIKGLSLQWWEPAQFYRDLLSLAHLWGSSEQQRNQVCCLHEAIQSL